MLLQKVLRMFGSYVHDGCVIIRMLHFRKSHHQSTAHRISKGAVCSHPIYALYCLPNLDHLHTFTPSNRHIDNNNLDLSTIWHVTSQEEGHSILLLRSI